jgi:predicted lactoylglutathione lyase
MATKIFVNLPVKDLNRSVAFFTKLGYTFNPYFTDENATCMVVTEDIYVMLLVEPYFQSFTKKDIPDTSKTSEVTICFSAESRTEVEEYIKKAFDAGGEFVKEPQEYPFMYGDSYADLDGHIWEVVWMDPASVPQG